LADIDAYIRMLTGTGPGPYNLYYRDANNSLVFREGPLTLNELYSTIFITVPETTKTVTLRNINPACKSYQKDIDITITPSPSSTPAATSTQTPTPTFNATPTITSTSTQTQTPTSTVTPTITSTPAVTSTQTPTPSSPLVGITVTLAIDSGNTGVTQIYRADTTQLLGTLTTNNSSITVSIPSGTKFFVQTILQTRQFSTDVAQINLYTNGVADACTLNGSYIQTSLNTPLKTVCAASYTAPDYYPIATNGNTYLINTYLGVRRPV
jgi:hypothetical protein